MCLPRPRRELHLQRDARGELGDAMVEEGDARFQADRHRRPVDLAQDVVGQIGDGVAIHHPQRGRQAPRRDRVPLAPHQVRHLREQAIRPRPIHRESSASMSSSARSAAHRSGTPSGSCRRNGLRPPPAGSAPCRSTGSAGTAPGSRRRSPAAGAANPLKLLPQAGGREIAIIAAEQLVAAIAGQRDLDLLARERG